MTLTQILQKISSVFAKKSELSNYLPLGGGQLTGLTINRNKNDSEIQINGGTSVYNGASFIAYGKDYNNGDFNIIASNGSTTKWLTGQATGSLTWEGDFTANNGKDGAFNTKVNSSGSTSIQSLASDGTSGAYLHLCNKNDANELWKGAFRLSTSKNGTDLSGFTNGSLHWCDKEVDTIDSQGDGYIRYSNGLQICYGRIYNDANGNNIVNLPKTFINDSSYSVQTTHRSDNPYYTSFTGSKTASTFKIYLAKPHEVAINGDGIVIDWFAVGKWK